MCNNITVLYIFFIIKILAYFIVPILLMFLRKNKIFYKILYIDIIVLSFFLISNITEKNTCVLNSTPNNIGLVKEFNILNSANEMHKTNNIKNEIKPNKKYKTYSGRDLYYYNLNKDYMKNVSYKCKDRKIYLNSIGSGITSFSTAISTLYDRNISPVEVFNIYKDNNFDICSSDISLEKIYKSTMTQYGGITLTQINLAQITPSIKEGGLVIAELSANENSKLTCDSDYIIIYSIGLDGKYKISDPALADKSFICPYSSEAYGNVIDSKNMDKSWTLDEINAEAIRYYLVKRG